MKVELHILQNFPPANLNRDDTGSPKDCEFGGVRRGRISSQCRKRRIRETDVFRQMLGERIAIRTKKSAEPLAERLEQNHGFAPEDARAAAEAVVGQMLGWDDAKQLTKVLFYVGYPELDRLAALIAERQEAFGAVLQGTRALPEGADAKAREKATAPLAAAADAVKKTFTDEQGDKVRAVDIALFGRMLAEAPGMNVDAACQVAHSISTNKVDAGFDYFTAVDDLNKDEETGAGMIGTTGFNSSCFYSYALIDADQLAKNLGGDRDLALEGIRAFLTASLHAVPTGKQNSFAAQTPPSLFMGVVRGNGGMPWSLANAFVNPVQPPRRPDGDGLVTASIKKLDEHWDSLADMYGTSDAKAFVKVAKDAGDVTHLADAKQPTAQAVIDAVIDALGPWAGGAEA